MSTSTTEALPGPRYYWPDLWVFDSGLMAIRHDEGFERRERMAEAIRED